ncbi:MAG: hypothetical protein HQK68_04935 [Desulfamplus sp.]|nr:hypothetical protein [Desulfamplus sp.]
MAKEPILQFQSQYKKGGYTLKRYICFYITITVACLTILLSTISLSFIGFDISSAIANQPIFPFAPKKSQAIESPSTDNKNIDNSEPTKAEATPPSSTPMVEKHIFSPEPDIVADSNTTVNSDGQNTEKAIDPTHQTIDNLMQKVKKEIELTGIIITPSSKRAMILYKGKGSKKQTPEFYDAGASIDEYLLKDVYPNYVVIAQNDIEIRVGLFQERSDRPNAPKIAVNQNIENKIDGSSQPIPQEIMNPENFPDPNINVQDGRLQQGGSIPMNPPQAIGQDPNSQAGVLEQIQDGNMSDMSNPFVRAMHDAAVQESGHPIISEEMRANLQNRAEQNRNTDTNPFLQAIKRARERQQSQQQ